uniref:Uncharacterized protein n=1 Tax=Geospiza parvula TaxID=87175 RepID=A0A8C3MF47_GEOPR
MWCTSLQRRAQNELSACSPGIQQQNVKLSLTHYPGKSHFLFQHIRKFINETWIDRYGSPLHPETVMLLWSFIVSVYGIGGFLGSLCCGYLTTKYRKKKCQMFTNLIMLVAALFMALSKTAKSFEMILVGRFLYGIGAGFSLNIHPQYVGEISPKKLRGFTNSTVAVFLTLGKLTGQVVGLREILGSEALWPWLLASSGLSALVQLVTLPFFPDSPSYLLIQKGNEEACRKGRVSAFLTYFPSPAVSQGEALQQRRQGRAVLGSITNLSKSMLLKQLRIVSQMQHLFSQVNFLFAFFRSTSILLKYSTQPSLKNTLSHTCPWELGFSYFPHIVLHFCLQDNLGPFCFLIFLGILVLSAIFIYLYLPETKGKSIMEIKAEFNKLNFGKKETSVTENNFPKEQLYCTKL